MQDIRNFIQFLLKYCQDRLLTFGKNFESIKDVIVAFLIVKRGKYSTPFLNTSFFILGAAAIIGAPVIAENNPFANQIDQQDNTVLASSVAFNPYESSLSTVVSSKPRDRIIDYKVNSGDTLASIAQKFGISVDTLKWQNKLKSDTIKTSQTLQILPVTGVAHKVTSGENIYTIAKKYKTDAQKIVNFPFNDFADLDNFSLTAGQTLYVPDGTIEDEVPKFANIPTTYSQPQAGVKGSSNFIWPASGLITQYPVWYHMAFDIANPSQPPILAADTGTVVYSGCIDWGYGCHIIIDHGNGFKTLYGHMSQLLVSGGAVVSQGQQIGFMGSTGRSTGTHLHFEIRSGDTLVNPQDYLK